MSDVITLLLPALPQQSNITRRQEEPEVPENVRRTTETLACRRIATRARLQDQLRGHVTLSRLHVELIRLERGVLQYLPHLEYDHRMAFIANAAHLRNVTARQMEALLDQASNIMLLADMKDIDILIEDYTPEQIAKLHRAWLGATFRPRQEKRQAPTLFEMRSAS